MWLARRCRSRPFCSCQVACSLGAKQDTERRKSVGALKIHVVIQLSIFSLDPSQGLWMIPNKKKKENTTADGWLDQTAFQLFSHSHRGSWRVTPSDEPLSAHCLNAVGCTSASLSFALSVSQGHVETPKCMCSLSTYRRSWIGS